MMGSSYGIAKAGALHRTRLSELRCWATGPDFVSLNSDDLAPARHASRKTSQPDRHRRAWRGLRGCDPGFVLLVAARPGRPGADAYPSARARGRPGALRISDQG